MQPTTISCQSQKTAQEVNLMCPRESVARGRATHTAEDAVQPRGREGESLPFTTGTSLEYGALSETNKTQEDKLHITQAPPHGSSRAGLQKQSARVVIRAGAGAGGL